MVQYPLEPLGLLVTSRMLSEAFVSKPKGPNRKQEQGKKGEDGASRPFSFSLKFLWKKLRKCTESSCAALYHFAGQPGLQHPLFRAIEEVINALDYTTPICG